MIVIVWIFLHSFGTEKETELHKRVCKDEDFSNVIMPTVLDTKIFDKAPFIIYADLECVIEKINGCKKFFATSSTTKVSEHIPSGFSMSAITLFRSI